MDGVCVSSTSYQDKTVQANDASANDVSLGRGSSNLPTETTNVFFGADAPFDELVINVGTAGTDGATDWSYWNGVGWIALTVTDTTNHFQSSGTGSVTFTPPSDWAPRIVNSNCPGSRYYLKAQTPDPYTVPPIGSQISVQPLNLRVRVHDELGRAVPGLTQTGFTVTGGSDNTIFSFRERGGGDYDLALAADLADTNFDIKATRDGYVTSSAASTGPLGSALSDLTSTPLVLSFAFKINAITAEAANAPLTGATVRTGDAYGVTCTEAAGAWYCPVPLAQTGTGIQATRDGYVTESGTSFGSDRTSHSDGQRSASIQNVRFTAKLTVTTESTLAGVTWERSVAGAAYYAVTPDVVSGNTAFFSQSPASSDVVYRAVKNSMAGLSGTAFTASAGSQTSRSMSLTAPWTAPPAPPADPLQVSGLTSSTHPIGVWRSAQTGAFSWSVQSGVVSCFSWRLDADPDTTCDGSGSSTTISGLADGAHVFKIRAQNTAGTWGATAEYGNFLVDATPPSQPTLSSTLQATGICARAPATFTWTSVDAGSGLEAERPFGYAFDGGPTIPTNQGSVTLHALRAGDHHLKVTAHDLAGNTATSTLAFSILSAPSNVSIPAVLENGSILPPESAICPGVDGPVGRAFSPPEAGPVFPVFWTSHSSRAPIDNVEIWVLENGSEPRHYVTSPRPAGSTLFYGISGHTYFFFAQATDASQRVGTRSFAHSEADSITNVTSARIEADDQAMAVINGTGDEPFYVEDRDQNGIPETFVDPSGKLGDARFFGGNATTMRVLIQDLTNAERYYLWDLLTNRVTVVIRQVSNDTKEIEPYGHDLIVRVQKQAETTILQVVDQLPLSELLRVLRGDGSVVPADRVWREEGQIYVFDNTSTEYQFVYANPVPSSPTPAPTPGWQIIALAFAAVLTVFVIWVEWPSVQRLVARPPRGRGMRWLLRHCGQCMHALPRPQRLLRSLHTCPAPTPPAAVATQSGLAASIVAQRRQPAPPPGSPSTFDSNKPHP